MSSVELEMRGLRNIPEAELDSLDESIMKRCDRSDSRAVVYLMLKIFSKLNFVAGSCVFDSTSDNMGGMILNIHFAAGEYFFRVCYEQSIRSSWHHVEIDKFAVESRLPQGVALIPDMDLTTDGWMKFSIQGIDETAAQEITAILKRSFDRVWPSGTNDPHITEDALSRERLL